MSCTYKSRKGENIEDYKYLQKYKHLLENILNFIGLLSIKEGNGYFD